MKKDKVLRVYQVATWVAIALAAFATINDVAKTREIRQIEHQEADSLSFRDELLTLIFKLRLEHPDIVFAQAILETGNFKSEIFKENKNLFGLKMSWNRPTLAVGVKRGHAVFSDWKHSVYDYALYQSSYMRKLTREAYLERLKSYAADPSYVEKIKNLL